MRKFFALTIGAIAMALTFSVASASAGNNDWNRVFPAVQQITPVQMGGGVANWRTTRPDNGRTMYFEYCERDPEYTWGFRCRGERLGTVQNYNPPQGSGTIQWNGTFHTVQQLNGQWRVVRPDNGNIMFFAYCEPRDNGWRCHTQVRQQVQIIQPQQPIIWGNGLLTAGNIQINGPNGGLRIVWNRVGVQFGLRMN